VAAFFPHATRTLISECLDPPFEERAKSRLFIDFSELAQIDEAFYNRTHLHGYLGGRCNGREGKVISGRLVPEHLVLFIGLFVANTIAAQEEAATDEIVVTGTRIARPEVDFANPVAVISADTIAQSGRTNLAELLVLSPTLLGSTTGDLTGGSEPDFGETGLNLLDLRNLGENRTLVLVDGRRHVAGLAGSAAVDINAIPSDLIEAVDILTGGASAIYGADGVSGVVNFRMKRDFEGVRLRAEGGTSYERDGESGLLAFTAGRNFAAGRGNVALAYEFARQRRVSDQDRSYLQQSGGNLYQNQDDLDDDPDLPDLVTYYDVRYADSARMGAVDVDFDLGGDLEGDGDPYDRGFLLENSGGYTVGGSSTPVNGYQGDLFPELDRHIVNLIGHYELSNRLTLYGEAKYARGTARSESQPTFDFYLFQTPENPFMPQAIIDAIVPGAAAAYFEDPETPDGVLVTRDHYDLGIVGEDITRETLRGVVGATGTLSERMKYDVYYTWGETRSRIVSVNNRLEAQWAAAVDVVTDPGSGDPICRVLLEDPIPEGFEDCLPYNIFGEGVRDPAAIDFAMEDTVTRTRVQQQVLSAALSGDLGGFLELPGGSIGYAVGAEWRDEESRSRPAQSLIDGLTWAETQLPVDAGFDVRELFAEVNLPVITDAPWAHLLSFGAAVRFSDYSTAGSSTSWKLDGVYAPVGSFRVRATWSQAVRAPNIAELFRPESTAFGFVVDPCDLAELNNGTATREANCAQLLTALGVDPETFSPSNSPQSSVFTEGLERGNPDLIEETARTWTAGVVWQPESFDGFSMTLDWYDIEIRDAINTPEAIELAELCVDQPTLDNPYCPAIDRDPETGFIIGYTAQPENVARFTTAGLDLALRWLSEPTRFGEFELKFVGNYLHELEFIAVPGASLDSDVNEEDIPEYSATFDASWIRGDLTLGYGVNWFSRTDSFTTEQIAGDPDYAERRFLRVKPRWDHEVRAAWDVNERLQVNGGVNNLFNQEPEFGYASYPISAMGRYFYLGAEYAFGE